VLNCSRVCASSRAARACSSSSACRSLHAKKEGERNRYARGCVYIVSVSECVCVCVCVLGAGGGGGGGKGASIAGRPRTVPLRWPPRWPQPHVRHAQPSPCAHPHKHKERNRPERETERDMQRERERDEWETQKDTRTERERETDGLAGLGWVDGVAPYAARRVSASSWVRVMSASRAAWRSSRACQCVSQCPN
jgi:hypothetical protein